MGSTGGAATQRQISAGEQPGPVRPALTGLIAGALAVYLLQAVWTWSFTMDDSFISYRYAKHIGDGIGPVWNLLDKGQPVEGFTSFLYVWLLGAIRFLTGADVVPLGKALGVAATLALSASVAGEIRRRRLGGIAAAAGLSFLALPFTAINSVSGMETSLFMLLNWLCAMACVRMLEAPDGRRAVTFVLLGLLATLTRPDFGLPFLLMAGFAWWRRPVVRGSLLRSLAAFYVLPGLAITGWRFAYFGDIVPNPFHVKQGGLNRYGATYVIKFLAGCASPFVLWTLAGWRSAWKRHESLFLVAAINTGAACAYFATTSPLMGWWYRFLLPQIPLLAFCAALALQDRGGRERYSRYLVPAGAAAFALLLAVHIPWMSRFLTFHEASEERYREVGRRLRPFAAPDRWLAYYDVGSIVYESEWNTIDEVGLNTLKKDLQSICEMKPDIVLRKRQRGEPPNPCPPLYSPLVRLPFLKQDPVVDSTMVVFIRNDLSYGSSLREGLSNGWPEQFTQPTGWLARWWKYYQFYENL